MKILATSDIHQMNSKWKELVKVCKKDKFDVVAIAGDLFPKDNGIPAQLSFVKSFLKYVKQIKDTGAKIVLNLGNDDNQLLIPDMEKAEDDGLIYYAHEKVFEIDGYEFVGMPYVPDYPFGYKYWCHAEFANRLRIDPDQFGQPVIIDDNNKFKEIPELETYLKSKIDIYGALIKLAKKVKDIKKSIWLIHAPPSLLGLDICAHGARVGSDAVLTFIEEYHPLLTIHGHIHESPEYSHKWNAYCKETLCVQGGQVGFTLHYSTIELEDGKIKSIKHSIYE